MGLWVCVSGSGGGEDTACGVVGVCQRERRRGGHSVRGCGCVSAGAAAGRTQRAGLWVCVSGSAVAVAVAVAAG